MKNKLVVTVLLIALFSTGVTYVAAAAPWRGHRHGWHVPNARVYAPVPLPVPVPYVAGGYYGGYRRHHHEFGPRYYYRDRNEGRRHYGHHYCR